MEKALKILAMIAILISAYNVNAQSNNNINSDADINVNIIIANYNHNVVNTSEVGLSFEKSIIAVGKTFYDKHLNDLTNFRLGLKMISLSKGFDIDPYRSVYFEVGGATATKKDISHVLGVFKGGCQVETTKGIVIQPAIGLGVLFGADNFDQFYPQDDEANGKFVDVSVKLGYEF